MTKPSESYRRVFYDLRPAKQVERRMILDALQHLAGAGFDLHEYQYTGFGSIYFVDFILLHRLLGMRRLLSVEKEESAESRVRFNKPFGDIEIRMGPIGDILPTLDRDRLQLLWLDYDHQLSRSDLQDVVLSCQVLPSGSILLVTVDVEPPPNRETPAEWRRYYEEEADELVPFDASDADFRRSRLGQTNARILTNAIHRGIVARTEIEYIPLFGFLYKDGHQMLTIGGVLGGGGERSRIDRSRVRELPFVRTDADGPLYEIKVPRLTRKERIYLDHHMPCRVGWAPGEFTIPPEEVQQYSEIYRFYPMYGELLI